MSSPRTPGVYVKEVPSGSRVIAGAGTSVVAFMGFARCGPTEPTRVRSWQEFTDVYKPAPIPKAFSHPNRPNKVIGGFTVGQDFYLAGATTTETLIHKCDLTAGVIEGGQGIKSLFVAFPDSFQPSDVSIYGNTRFYFLKGLKCAAASQPSSSSYDQIDISASSWLGGGPTGFTDNWDAAAADSQGKVYVFKGDSCIEGNRWSWCGWSGTKKIAERFPWVPAEFHSGLDGAVVLDGVLYLFKGQKTVQAVLTGVLADAVFGYFANGGGPCYITRIPTIKPDGTSALSKAEILQCFTGTSTVYPGAGLAGLEGMGEVTMVTAPDVWSIPGVTKDEVKPVQQAMAKHCAKMGNRMAILDPPKDTKPEDAAAYPGHLGLPKAYQPFAALYYPWVEVAGLQGEECLVPPSGHVAGVWCRTDERRGVHKAPANEALAAVTALEKVLSDTDQAGLNPVGVNCLRSFTGEGIVVWGARTLSDTDDWRYLNVRRLVNFISASIKNGTTWAVFEPNDERLRASLRTSATVFLTGLWRDGALKGHTVQEAFYVICDQSNNRPETIAAGTVVCDIGLAAVRPAEFVHFTLTQKTATSS
ncbi:phage tail sheath subtilisin-like domain-containing protein [Nocardia terpenica]|uniref:Phage tail sheath family protein n=1 Tax=Nocardia terpenica TaxID=455432 RepID=A0A6G9ZE95_9NOCA|nr:phage tail sheath subtilisin-like domain-containing protein [Nocardia terpenica]QIS23436.1 hypothetical protein F6W96_39070 [Nocardia terpenica]